MSTPEQIGTEVAKAVGEAAKEALSNLLGPATKEVGFFAGDLVAQWRLANLLKVYEKVTEKHGDSKLPKEAVDRLPFGFRALFVDGASKEEEDSIQDLWAQLLNSSIECGASAEAKSILDDLSRMTSTASKILVLISAQPSKYECIKIKDNRRNSHDIQIWKFDNEVMRQVLLLGHDEIQKSYFQLMRLRLIEPLPDSPDVGPIYASNVGPEAEELASNIAQILEEYVASAPADPEARYDKYKYDEDQFVMYFDAELTPYGREFLKYCLGISP